MKVLIFGVTGNAGREVAKFFLQKDATVIGIGRRDKLDGLEAINYIQGDIQNKDFYKKLPKEIDLVINFAGVQPSILKESEQTNLYGTLREYVNVNMSGTYNVIEWVSQSNAKTYIYATTHRDYENYWVLGEKLKNNLPPAINYQGDHSMYAISKVVGQMMGDYILPLKSVRCFNLRLPMIFMVPESPFYLSNGEKKIMPFLKLIKDAILGNEMEIWGNPNLPRDYVYIDNLLNIIDCCWNSKVSGGTFTVGTGEGATTEYFVKTIASVFAPNIKRNFKYRPEKRTYKSAVYDTTETSKLLKYKPIYLRSISQHSLNFNQLINC